LARVSKPVRTKVLPESILNLVKRSPRLYQLGRAVRMGLGSRLPPRRLPGLPGRVHFNDFMLGGTDRESVESYRSGALNAVGNIDASLAAIGLSPDDIETWLDFGCGYGRVLRFLAQRVEPSRIAATDVIVEGVHFCAEEFGATALHSNAPLDRLRLGSFDFIYAISVLTHLNERDGTALLAFMRRSLNIGGVCMFTTHGRWSMDHLDFYGPRVVRARSSIHAGVEARGFAFLPYEHYRDDSYGLAWHAKGYLERLMSALHDDRMELIRFEPHGLDRHQDVFAYRRNA
jgi:SAM-dependent methyltransferase